MRKNRELYMFTLISNTIACVRTFLRGKLYKGNYKIFSNFKI